MVTSETSNGVDERTIFERHPAEWRVFAVVFPAAFAGSWAGVVAEQGGLSGSERTITGVAVCVSAFLMLNAMWERLLRWLSERRAARPTV